MCPVHFISRGLWPCCFCPDFSYISACCNKRCYSLVQSFAYKVDWASLPNVRSVVYCCPSHYSAAFWALNGQELCLSLFVFYGMQFGIRHVVVTERVLNEWVMDVVGMLATGKSLERYFNGFSLAIASTMPLSIWLIPSYLGLWRDPIDESQQWPLVFWCYHMQITL